MIDDFKIDGGIHGDPPFAAPQCSVTDVIGDICNVPTRPGYRNLEQEAVDFLLDGIPAKGGYVSHYMLEKIVRAAFRGGIMATKPKSPNSDSTTKKV